MGKRVEVQSRLLRVLTESACESVPLAVMQSLLVIPDRGMSALITADKRPFRSSSYAPPLAHFARAKKFGGDRCRGLMKTTLAGTPDATPAEPFARLVNREYSGSFPCHRSSNERYQQTPDGRRHTFHLFWRKCHIKLRGTPYLRENELLRARSVALREGTPRP